MVALAPGWKQRPVVRLIAVAALGFSFGTDLDNDVPAYHSVVRDRRGDSHVIACPPDDADCNRLVRLSHPCWGYEDNCDPAQRVGRPSCNVLFSPYYTSLAQQLQTFFEEGDFGYVRKKMLSVRTVCLPTRPDGSMLRCAENMHYCQAKNIFLDFTRTQFSSDAPSLRTDLFKPGDIGGHCSLDKSLLVSMHQGNFHNGSLHSWYSEMEHFTEIKEDLSESSMCDVTVHRPTVFMKLDAPSNLYHHFCDFINLYASQHMNGSFSRNVNIVIWDTSSRSYYSPFRITWKAFSRWDLVPLKRYEGKFVCFKDALFPLLPRLIRGLYFNMPLVEHCEGSSLFKAFSEHVLHRLGLLSPALGRPHANVRVRVTFQVRGTPYRRILNKDELFRRLTTIPHLQVTMVDFSSAMPFEDQLRRISRNTDVLIGMHGAGLTHALFLPDWGALFEVYNTEDADCYKDLARLRGVFYVTWQNASLITREQDGGHPQRYGHKKFANFEFDPDEFVRLTLTAADHVIRRRPDATRSRDEL